MKFEIKKEILKDALRDANRFRGARSPLAVLHGYYYPRISFEHENGFQMNTADLLKAVDAVSFSAGFDEGRPVLTGINLTVEGNMLKAVATDSYRLAYTEVPVKGSAETEGIIPAKPLKGMSVFAFSDNVEVAISPKNMVISSEDEKQKVMLKIRGIEGRFPAVENLFSETAKGTNIFTISVSALRSAVDRASLFSEATEHHIISFSFNEDEATIESHAQEIGSSKEVLDCSYQGKNVSFAFDSRYISDVLRHMNSEEIEIRMGSEMRPVYMAPASEDGNEKYIVLPVRVH